MPQVRPRTHHDRTRLKSVVITTLAATLFIAVAPESGANTVDAISWGHDPDGNTTITIVCSDPFDESSFRSYAIADPPRAVVVLSGITNPLKPDEMMIEDRHVIRLRLGHNEDGPVPELSIILDLVSDTGGILDLRHTGNKLVAVIGSRHEPTPTSTPSPTPEPSPTPSPRPTEETPTPTVTPSETPAPSYPDRPAPPVLPPIEADPAVVPSPTNTPAHAAEAFSTPTPGAESEIADRVVDLVANLRSDGSTLLRITGNGRLPHGCARTLAIAEDPPRIILSLRGFSAPDLPRTIEIGDPNLNRIRLVHDAETSEGELHLVLQLERPGVSLIELKQVGPHLAVQLAADEPPPPTP